MYISVWVTSPMLAYGMIYRALALLSIIIWLVLELFDKRSVFFKPNLYLIVLYVFLGYTLTISYMVDGSASLGRNIQFFLMLFFLFVYASYQRKSLEILKPVIYLNIILFTIWMGTTYTALLHDSHAARYVIRSDEISMALSKKGVGGFSFIYSLLIYIIAIMALINSRIQQKKKFTIVTLFLLFSVALGILVVLKAEYSTAVLLMVFSIIFFLLYSKSIQKNVILFFAMIIFFIAFKFYIVDILQALLPYAEGTNYQHKILDSIASMNVGETVGTAGDRLDRYIRSLNLFIDNPLTGVWSIQDVGKHSLLLDTFAQFGIFAGLVLIYVLLKVPYQIYKKSNKQKTLSLTIIFLIIALISLNNVTMSYGFMFYIFYPYIIQRLENA